MPSKLDIVETFRYGFGRIGTRNGAVLAALYVVVQFATQVTAQSAAADVTAGRLPADAVERAYPLAVDLPAAVAGGLTALLVLAGAVLGIVTMRAFYRDLADFPTAAHTRRLVRTVLVTVVVSVVVFVAVAVGTVLFVLPGVFLAVSLVFSVLAVVLEDAGVVEALRRSWSLTAGNRLRLFVVGFVLVVVSGVVGAAVGAVGIVAPLVGDVGGAVVAGVTSVLGVGVLVGAYRQLSTAGDGAADSERASTAL